MKGSSKLKCYATRPPGSKVVTFLSRPLPAGAKRYREPHIIEQKEYPNILAAKEAVKAWRLP